MKLNFLSKFFSWLLHTEQKVLSIAEPEKVELSDAVKLMVQTTHFHLKEPKEVPTVISLQSFAQTQTRVNSADSKASAILYSAAAALIASVESVYPPLSGAGRLKKTTVLNGVRSVANEISEDFQFVETELSNWIDATITAYNTVSNLVLPVKPADANVAVAEQPVAIEQPVA